MNSESKGPFYETGLQFSCTRCSCCCRFDTGYVWLSITDLDRLAKGLITDRRAVIDTYCCVVDLAGFKRLSLREQENKDCVFWRDGGCSIYEHRPTQCKNFPFWGPYLDSLSDWKSLESSCPGINIGKPHSQSEIDRLLAERRWESPLTAEVLDRMGGP